MNEVIISDFRKTKEISLPSYKDSKVVIYSGLLFGQAMNINHGNELERVTLALPQFIKEWNLFKAPNEPMPVNADSLKVLNMEDVTYLAEEVKKFVDEEKKN